MTKENKYTVLTREQMNELGQHLVNIYGEQGVGWDIVTVKRDGGYVAFVVLPPSRNAMKALQSASLRAEKSNKPNELISAIEDFVIKCLVNADTKRDELLEISKTAPSVFMALSDKINALNDNQIEEFEFEFDLKKNP